MDGLVFYVIFNSISVMIRRWIGDNEHQTKEMLLRSCKNQTWDSVVKS